jgi:hypothetical protein
MMAKGGRSRLFADAGWMKVGMYLRKPTIPHQNSGDCFLPALHISIAVDKQWRKM